MRCARAVRMAVVFHGSGKGVGQRSLDVEGLRAHVPGRVLGRAAAAAADKAPKAPGRQRARLGHFGLGLVSAEAGRGAYGSGAVGRCVWRFVRRSR